MVEQNNNISCIRCGFAAIFHAGALPEIIAWQGFLIIDMKYFRLFQ